MFTEKELMGAYGYALGADQLAEVMVGHLAGLLPCGIPLNEMTFGLIRTQVDRFLAK